MIESAVGLEIEDQEDRAKVLIVARPPSAAYRAAADVGDAIQPAKVHHVLVAAEGETHLRPLVKKRTVIEAGSPHGTADMLGGHPGLRLDSLDTLAPEPVTAAGSGPVSGVKTASDTGLFKHGVRLTLVGDYDALTRYMEKLERLPVRFYWDRAELDAAAHPDIRLTLILYTLSLERTWLTV